MYKFYVKNVSSDFERRRANLLNNTSLKIKRDQII
jgi:hypothetical protein